MFIDEAEMGVSVRLDTGMHFESEHEFGMFRVVSHWDLASRKDDQKLVVDVRLVLFLLWWQASLRKVEASRRFLWITHP